MPHIKVNDISMYYETHGQGEPLVLIAGFTADHTVWSGIVELLQDTYQVIVFDNRGAGQTDIPDGPYSIDQMADDVAALCSALGIAKAHFVGNSMGGCIAQNLAYRYPKIMKSVVISHSAPAIQAPFHYFVEAQLELIKAKAPQAPLFKVLCSWSFSYRFLSMPGVLEQLIQLGLDNPHPFTIKGYEGQMPALEHFDSRPWLSQIKVPALVLGSDQDLILRESLTKSLAEQIPNAHYYRFNECGHLPQIESPEELSKVIREFIGRF